MLIFNNTRKADRDLYNNSAENFIPIACHYDANTLLTKNGELLQTIQINGINSEHIASQLSSVREIVRRAIKKNVESDNFAFWVHTIRHKTNLDDPTQYSKIFPANVHDMWKNKNFWDDKFVNTLYISIIHEPNAININNIKSMIGSLFSKELTNLQEQYLSTAFKNLNNIVDNILSDLKEYGAEKLGIRFVENDSLSDPLSLYHQIVHLTQKECIVPIADLSLSLSSNRYALGSDKIEVITSDLTKKFAAILSIKEYQEISTDALDRFLQLPIELIATEIFCFVDSKDVIPLFKEQDYILKVSRDNKLAEMKKSQMLNLDDNDSKFCKQQISIAILSDDVATLDKDVAKASRELSNIGIVHVREDIKLEQTFWAQLPGNFSFLRRMSPTSINNICALASLHNFPTGKPHNPWGKAVTLLRTEKGTPYFMNFHTSDKGGNTCIFGTPRTGKTVLTNFLLSETSKVNPNILYIATNNDSKIFISALEGTWIEDTKNLFNPFLVDDTSTSRQFISEFLKIICGHYKTPLTNTELAFLENIPSKAFALEPNNRNFSNVLKTLDFSLEGGDLIKEKFSAFEQGGLYHGIFDNKTNLSLSANNVVGINLNYFTDEHFTALFYPNESKLIDKFNSNLIIHKNVRTAIIYALSNHLIISSTSPKILALDNINELLQYRDTLDIMADITNKLTRNNGITLGNFNISSLDLNNYDIITKWMGLFNTKIVLSSDVKIEDLDKIFGFNKREVDKWLSFTIPSRMFLIVQENESIAAELSIGALTGIVKILSAGKAELNIYEKIITEYPGHVEHWIHQLYKAFNFIE